SRIFHSARATTTMPPATRVTTAVRRAMCPIAASFPGAPLPQSERSPHPLGERTFPRYNGRPMAADELVVHGAREHNLKDITVRLPRNALICITGLSGS